MEKKIKPRPFPHQSEDSRDLPESLNSCLLDLQRAEETIKHQHRQLYQLEARYNELSNSLDEAFCIIEVLFAKDGHPQDYRFLKVNSAFEVQTGIKDPLGRTMREIAPKHEQEWFEIYGRIARTGIAQRFEHGAEALGRFYDVYAFRIGDPKDAQVAILFKDIGQRKIREKRQAYLLQLSDLLRSSSEPSQIQESVTQLAMNHFGADRCYFFEIEDGKTAGFPILAPFINAGRPFVVDDTNQERLDEEVRLLCIQAEVTSFINIPIVRKGTLRGVFCVACCEPRKWAEEEIETAQDTAERTWVAIEQVKAGEALRKSEESYRAIVSQSLAGILKICLRGNIIFTNEQFCRMLGYDEPTLLKLSVDDVVHEEDRMRNLIAFKELVSEGKAYEIEKRLVRKDKSVIWVNNHVSPIFDKKGGVEAATVVSIDISRQKELERQKDEFIGIASHELKTPITSIKAYGEILACMMDNTTTSTIVQLVTKMNVQINRLVKLIYSLLNTSRISSGQLALQLEPVDLNALLEEHVLQGQLTTSRHRIYFAAQQLPLVFADIERLGQVVDNLISNAIKYAPKGGDIVIKAESRGGYVRVSVQDFGMGVPKAMQEKIFDRFYRVKGASAETVSGIGLGLYICHEIIEKHRGQMGVESIPEEGSIFYFELPVHTV